MSKKKILEDAEVKAEFDKLISRVPGWFKKSTQNNTTILVEFMKLYDENRVVSHHKLKEQCAFDTFESNFRDMSGIYEKGNGKVFEVKKDKVILWQPAELFIVSLWKKYKQKYLSSTIKVFIIGILTSCMFVSCSSSDDDSINDSKDGKWKKIVRSNINEAQYIFSTLTDGSMRSASLRSSTNNSSFGAIDVNGAVKDIRFFDEDGDSYQPLIIHGIADVGDEFVICGITLFQDIREETENSSTITTISLFRNLLINKNTGIVYAFPNRYEAQQYETYNSLINWYYDIKAYSDAQKNLYMCYHDGNQLKISKIDIHDPDNISIEDYLPQTEMNNLSDFKTDDFSEPFTVNASGVCAYCTSPQGVSSYNPYDYIKLKCPGGRIYPVQQLIPEDEKNYSLQHSEGWEECYYHLFLGHNGHYYIATCKTVSVYYEGTSTTVRIYKLSEPTNNEIISEKVAELLLSKYINSYCIHYSIANPEKQTHFWALGGKAVEFDEKENTIIETGIEIPELSHDTRLFYTFNATYIGNAGFQHLIRVPFNDYSNQKDINFQKLGYEAYTMTSSMSFPELSFTGLRYADANYVIGIVDATGNVNCLESTALINEKTILIRMN